MKKYLFLILAAGMILSCRKQSDIIGNDSHTSSTKQAMQVNGMVASNDSAFNISTYAGSGTAGSSNGTSGSPLTAQFDAPEGIVFDSNGNMFIADTHNHVIRKITSAGVVSVFAGAVGVTGAANGSATVARFNSPIRLAIDAADNLYVADRDNARIRKVTSAGVVSTIAGTTAGSGSTQFNWPIAVAVSSDGTKVYVADSQNNRIQKIILSGGTYTTSLLAGQTLAGYANGTGSAAKFSSPSGVDIDNSGNIIVADRNNHCIRKVTSGGVVSLLAGVPGTNYDVDAPALKATLGQPFGVTVANDGCIYIADIGYHNIRRLCEGFLATVAGDDNSGYANGNYALFNTPTSITIDGSGNFYVTDANNNRIRKLAPETRTLQYTEGWSQSTPFTGITWYQHTGNRFWLSSQQTNKNQNVNVLDIDLSVNHFDFMQVDSIHKTTVTNIIGHPTSVIAALSGTFATVLAYAPGPQKHEAAYLRNNNVTYWSSAINPASNYWNYHEGMFYVNTDGTAGMEKSNMSQIPFSPTLHKYMMSGAPMLIENSVAVEITNPSPDWGTPPQNLRVIIAARAAVALPIINNHVLLIFADGIERNEANEVIGSGSCYVPQLTYYGMTTKDLAQFIKQYFNATYAINMDGGGSASMCLMGAGDNGGISGGIGVIGHPDWDSTCPSDRSAYGQQRNFMRDCIAVIPN